MITKVTGLGLIGDPGEVLRWVVLVLHLQLTSDDCGVTAGTMLISEQCVSGGDSLKIIHGGGVMRVPSRD